METIILRVVRLYGPSGLVALGLLGVCGAWLFVGPETAAGLALALGAGVVALALLALQARRDPWPSFVLLGIAAGSFLTLGASWWGLARQPVPATVRHLSVGCAVLLALSLVQLSRFARGRDANPNPLVERCGWKKVREVLGVQVALEFTPAVRPGDDGWVRVHLLNAWDAPREVAVHCVPKGGLGVRLEPADLQLPRFEETIFRTELGPFETGALTVHVAAFKPSGGAFSPFPELLIAVIPSGRGGRRVRLPFARRAGLPRFDGDDGTPDSGFLPLIRIRADAPAAGPLPPLGWQSTRSPPDASSAPMLRTR